MGWEDDIRVRFPDWGTDAARDRWPNAKARLSVSQMVRGEVIARAPFGVWVDIGAGQPALLLVPEMAGAWVRSVKFEDYPPLGAVIEARITRLGDHGEIGLSQHPYRVGLTAPQREQLFAGLETRGWSWHEGYIYAPHRTMWLSGSQPWERDLQEFHERMVGRLHRNERSKWMYENDADHQRLVTDTRGLVETLAEMLSELRA
jgi:hypothetical protein